jgi:hypothetical protein
MCLSCKSERREYKEVNSFYLLLSWSFLYITDYSVNFPFNNGFVFIFTYHKHGHHKKLFPCVQCPRIRIVIWNAGKRMLGLYTIPRVENSLQVFLNLSL